MLVTVEDTPNLVVGPPAASLRFTSFASLRFNSSLDELQGSASIRIELDPYSVAALAAPVCEVQVLGTKTFDEHEQVKQNRGL
jgi:hypothetical protein